MKPENIGKCLIVATQTSFALDTGAIHMAGKLTIEQIGLLRAVGGFVLIAGMVWFTRAFPRVLPKLARENGRTVFHSYKPWWQVARVLTFMGYAWVMVISFSYLPFTSATAISFLQVPYMMLMTPLLKEVPTKWRWFGVVAGFIGTMMIVRPDWPENEQLIAIFVALGTALNAAAVVMNRYLVEQVHDNPLTIALYVTAGTVLCFAYGALQPFPAVNPLLLTTIAVTGPLGMLLGLIAMHYAGVGPLAVWFYVRLPIAIIGAAFLFGEVPDILSCFGISAIVFGCIIASIKKA
jgi:drug/metabolite transporter (DMT)-like permease